MAGMKERVKFYIASYSLCLEITHVTATNFSLPKTSYMVSPYVIGTWKWNLSTGRGSKYLRTIMQSAIVLSKYLLIK